jgi:hypothetical protein
MVLTLSQDVQEIPYAPDSVPGYTGDTLCS